MGVEKDNLHTFVIACAEIGKRLDIFLAKQELSLTRSRIKRIIEEGFVSVNAKSVKAGYLLKDRDVVVLQIEGPKEYSLAPENIPLDIIYEDEAIIVVNKSSGMVVHPAAGNYHGTLVNAVLYHCKDLSGIGGCVRPGIVHRLDKNTSGAMVVAKSDEAHISLSKQFKEHVVNKIYEVLVIGNVAEEEGIINLSVGRHPVNRKKMSTKSRRGREALSRWKVEERYGCATLLYVRIETGRTHQIRVHLNAVGYPIVGDTVYGNSSKIINLITEKGSREILRTIRRQALHASTLGFYHPRTGKYMEFKSSLPEDIACVCKGLREYLTR